MKIVVLDGGLVNPGDLSWEQLAAFGEVETYEDTPPGLVMERAATADVLISNRAELDDALFDACPHLRYIGLFSTGTNLVDLAATRKRGIIVTNVPGYSTSMVAQHTIALLLAATNRVAEYDKETKAGHWVNAEGILRLPMIELAGKTFGCVGFGEIGRAVGRIAQAMGMRVLACGSRPTKEGQLIAEYVSFEELIAEADVVSLHCPLKDDTRGIINQLTLNKMKQGCILLNTARGALVEEAALAEALESGQLAAAGIDVTWPEPLADDSALKDAPNLFITPHVAWTARETRARLLDIVVDNLASWLDGRPRNVVN